MTNGEWWAHLKTDTGWEGCAVREGISKGILPVDESGYTLWRAQNSLAAPARIPELNEIISRCYLTFHSRALTTDEQSALSYVAPVEKLNAEDTVLFAEYEARRLATLTNLKNDVVAGVQVGGFTVASVQNIVPTSNAPIIDSLTAPGGVLSGGTGVVTTPLNTTSPKPSTVDSNKRTLMYVAGALALLILSELWRK